MIAAIFREICAIFALQDDVLHDGQFAQSDSWLFNVASSPLAAAGERNR